MAVVGQDPLFNDTVAANIALAPGASRAEVEQAARVANAHDFILEPPQGYDTRVDELGQRLSGGSGSGCASPARSPGRPGAGPR